MDQSHRGYVSYLLRLWQVQENGEWMWRASLESSQTGKKRFFANLDDLLMFVRANTSELPVNFEGRDNLQG